MKDYKLSKAERETIITLNEEGSTANVYSCSQPWINKIKKLDGWKECGCGVEVEVPKAWIKFPKGPKKMTASQLKALAAARKKSPTASK